MPRLTDKVAFITGAGTGIGRATAMLFAREGAQVVIADIDAAAGEESAHLAGNRAIAIHADVTDEDNACGRRCRATIDKFGRLDVLHNNAGGSTCWPTTPRSTRRLDEIPGRRSSSTSLSARFSAAGSAFRSSSNRAAARSST